MELKSYRHILRNKLLFNWLPPVRPAVYALYKVREDPVVIFGNQKTGTSAIAALLARATGNDYDIDIAGFRNPEYTRLHAGEVDFRELVEKRARIEFSKGVVKEPNLTFLQQQVRDAFPRARYVFINRSPHANIRSILNRLDLPGNLPELSQEQQASMSPIWRAILYNEWVTSVGGGVPNVSQVQSNYVGAAAERWVSAVEQYLPYAEDTALVRYEDFNQNKQGTIERLAQTLGMPVTTDIADRVDTQYQPKGKRTTDYLSFFGAENLRIINETTAPYLERFNYVQR